ncbi:MAG: DUF6178 family protein, partial [Pseudomonadota bacterium]
MSQSPAKRLSSSPTLRQVYELLENPNARHHVQELSAMSFNRLVCQAGLFDSIELLALAKSEQIRDLVDLQVWDNDRVDPICLSDWLVALGTLPENIRASHLDALDVELIAYFLRRYLRIYLAKEDEIPEEPEGVFMQTPDGWFVLDLLEDDQVSIAKIQTIVENLYVDDPNQARRLLQNVMWELPTELEELGLRWRNGRLQDMGFEDPIQSLELYAYLDPDSVNPTEKTQDTPLRSDPEPFGHTELIKIIPAENNSFWAKTVQALSDEKELKRIGQALVTLCNRSLAADRILLSDLELAKESMEQLHWR